MPFLNSIHLLGHAGKDCETKQVNGTTLSTFSLATTEHYTGKDGSKQKKTTWHRIVCWGWVGDAAAESVRKGDLVFVQGSLETRSYQNRDGQEQSITEIKARIIAKCAPGPRRDPGKGYASQGDYPETPPEDVPF